MTVLLATLTGTVALTEWLQQLLRQRLHPQIHLVYKSYNAWWELSCSDCLGCIRVPRIASLYRLGSQPDLPCLEWVPESEGFIALAFKLPAPGLAVLPHPLIHTTDSGYHLGYDILGLTFWMLARCEEVNPPSELLNNYDNFSASSSHAYRHGYLERPIVDEWLAILGQLLQRLWPRFPLRRQHFCIRVSHDVDVPSAYAFGRKRVVLRAVLSGLIRRREVAGVLCAPYIRLFSRRRLHPSDPLNTFDWLMDASDSLGIKSAFYFQAGRTNKQFDAAYEPEHPSIRALMRCIHQRGHEIGLHPSYNSFDSPLTIVQEATRLRRIAAEEGIHQLQWGGRMHFLRWQWPITAHGWEQAGFHYDSTLGYADHPGFRCGTCYAYPMFDPLSQRQLKLVQRPLILMECSLIEDEFLGLGYGPTSLSFALKLREYCLAVGGQFTLLWHNSHFTTVNDREMYLKLLSY